MTTVRTIRLKRGGSSAPDPEPVADLMAAETAAPASSPQPAAVPEVSAKAAARSTVSSKSYLIYVIAAVLTVAGIATILGLQYSEMGFYKAEPCSWAGGAK